MTAKSIIDVEVNYQAFKNFSALFAKYQEQLSKMPAGWNKVNAGISEADVLTKQLAFDLEDSAAHLRKLDKYQTLFNKHVKDGGVSFNGIGKATGKILKNVKDTTGFLLKWAGLGGVIGGLMGTAGLFGFGGLASSASNLRRQSMGMGVTPGQLQSAQAHYGKYMDVNATLGGINDAQTDANKRYQLSLLGISPSDIKNKSSAELLPQVIEKMVDAFKRYGGNRNVLEGSGLTNIMDYNTMRQLSALSPEERKKTATAFSSDSSGMDINDKSLRAMQEFSEQIEVAKKNIEAAFVTGLAPLAPQLSKLSESISNAIGIFMKNPNMGKNIEDFGHGIEAVAKYFNSAEFKNDIGSFAVQIRELGGVIKSILHPIDALVGPKVKENLKDWNKEDLERRDEQKGAKLDPTKKYIKESANELESRYETVERKTRNWPKWLRKMVLQGTSKPEVDTIGTRLDDLRNTPSIEEQAPPPSSGKMSDNGVSLRAKDGSGMQKTIDDISAGKPLAHPVTWNGQPLPSYHTPPPLVRVTVQNNTGGSAVTSAAALAHQ